jgi:hypothetical protein
LEKIIDLAQFLSRRQYQIVCSLDSIANRYLRGIAEI